MGEDDPRVGMGRQEDLEQFAQQLLSQEGDGGMDLEQAQHQNIRTALTGKCQEFSNLGNRNIMFEIFISSASN